jgi:hypothetical protein
MLPWLRRRTSRRSRSRLDFVLTHSSASTSSSCVSSSSEESIPISCPSSASSSDGIAGCRNANKSLSPSRRRILRKAVCEPSVRVDDQNAKKPITYISKYVIERASSPIESSASMMVLSRINNRRTDGSAGVSPPFGRGRVVVGVSERFDPHGVLGVGECSKTCRSIPAVATIGSTGWMSVLLTIDRWPWTSVWVEFKGRK